MNHDNQRQFLNDMFDTFSHPKTYMSCLFCSAFFGLFGLIMSFIMLEDVFTYLDFYTTYQAFFVLQVFCMIGGGFCLYSLLKYYFLMYGQGNMKERMKILPIMFASMIPGFIMLMYVVMISSWEFSLPLTYICFYLCIYALCCIVVFYAIVKWRIEGLKRVYQKKTFGYVQGFFLVIFVCLLVVTFLLRGLSFVDIPKIILIAVIVTFLAYQCARA